MIGYNIIKINKEVLNMKKLYKEFSTKEKKLLNDILKKRNDKSITIIDHAKDRMLEKGVDKRDVDDCLKAFDVIELHQKGWDTRVLLRGRAKDELGRNTCMSLSLVTFRIITVYKNYANDNHRTLVEENYEDIEVEDLLKRLL